MLLQWSELLRCLEQVITVEMLTVRTVQIIVCFIWWHRMYWELIPRH